MKKTCLLISFTALLLAACTKTTNNTTIISQGPSFLVNGIHDVTIQNGSYYGETEMELTVQYSDSSQNVVNLSLSALPASIAIDTTWVTSGIPTYTTMLVIYDTTAAGATPGKYPMVLTATTATGIKKTYPFNLTIQAQPPCTGPLLGKYTNCNSDCAPGVYYTDSVYNDPNVVNKVWFNNFANAGAKVFGTYSCATGLLTIPSQTIGANTYSGSGELFSTHQLSVSYTNGATSCDISMR